MLFLSDIHLLLFCEKNSDGTKYLVLHGKELFQRYGKRIEDRDMVIIAKFLKRYPEIVKLNLCYNNIGNDGLRILVEKYLMRRDYLEELILSGCNIGWQGIECLYSARKYLRLKSLRLNGNKIGNKGSVFLTMLCEEYKLLEHLDVGECDLTLQCAHSIMGCFRDDNSPGYSIKVLDLSRVLPNTCLSQLCSSNFADNLAKLLLLNNSLVELHAQKCEMDGHDICAIVDALAKNNTLKFLDIGYNRIGNYGIDNIARLLKRRPSLIGLNVADNGITNDGAKSLFFAIPFSKLRLLDLTNNRLEDEGIYDILKSIRKPYIMRYLFLFGNTNNISQRTAKTLDRILRINFIPQDCIDLKVFKVDDKLKIAFNPINHYKHRYYCEMDYGYPPDIKIKHNEIIPEDEPVKPREKVNFLYYDRQPPIQKEEFIRIHAHFKPVKDHHDAQTTSIDDIRTIYSDGYLDSGLTIRSGESSKDNTSDIDRDSELLHYMDSKSTIDATTDWLHRDVATSDQSMTTIALKSAKSCTSITGLSQMGSSDDDLVFGKLHDSHHSLSSMHSATHSKIVIKAAMV